MCIRDRVGVMHPAGLVPNKGLAAGDVGYIAASIKNIQDTRVGDTITTVKNAAAEPLPGYKKVNPMVYSGIYPADGAQYEDCLLYTSISLKPLDRIKFVSCPKFVRLIVT